MFLVNKQLVNSKYRKINVADKITLKVQPVSLDFNGDTVEINKVKGLQGGTLISGVDFFLSENWAEMKVMFLGDKTPVFYNEDGNVFVKLAYEDLSPKEQGNKNEITLSTDLTKLNEKVKTRELVSVNDLNVYSNESLYKNIQDFFRFTDEEMVNYVFSFKMSIRYTFKTKKEHPSLSISGIKVVHKFGANVFEQEKRLLQEKIAKDKAEKQRLMDEQKQKMAENILSHRKQMEEKYKEMGCLSPYQKIEDLTRAEREKNANKREKARNAREKALNGGGSIQRGTKKKSAETIQRVSETEATDLVSAMLMVE